MIQTLQLEIWILNKDTEVKDGSLIKKERKLCLVLKEKREHILDQVCPFLVRRKSLVKMYLINLYQRQQSPKKNLIGLNLELSMMT